jgi:hypothetical protein
MSNYNNSSYWLNDFNDDDIVVGTMSDMEKKSYNLYKLASSKRAISNFVNIVTNDSIPVMFNTRGNSYTDGKTVVIGANIEEPKDFDVAVGLALHEGSHIKLSDFKILANIYSLIPTYVTEGAIKKGINNSVSVIKDLWNYVEDRRIDNFVFNSAPGYRNYYRAMYDKYFNDSLIDKALLSDEYTTEEVDSYMFRIINLHNKNTSLTALKGLREIYKVVGLNTISRLKSTEDTFKVALKIFQIILSNLDEVKQDGGDEKSQSMSDDEFDDMLDNMDGSTDMSGDMDNGGGNSMESDVDVSGGKPSKPKSSNSDSKKVELSDRQKELLQKKIEKQKQFMDGDIRKKAVSKKDQETIEALNESGSEVTTVGQGVDEGYGYVSKGVDCIVVKKLTKSLFENETFPMTQNNYSYNSETVVRMDYQDEVQNGIKLGTILGRKLQVRGEDRNTIFNRQRVGKIDKRMISSLGFGNENVFQYMETDSYKKANLHVSIDASGSMGGSKWRNTLTNVVALCKAVDMIQNLTIQVSFRTTSGNTPYIVMAYDSRTDKFSKVKSMFGGLCAGGTTPEGLCFEAIMKNFLGSNNDMDSYFLNISDGEPYFHGRGFYYGGEMAADHTRKMVKQIEGFGIKTMAYFIGDGEYLSSSSERLFKKMYGSGAQMINVTSVSQITKTMNTLFLSK